MGGQLQAQLPHAPADAPSWASTVIRDLCNWVLAIRRGPQVLTGYTSTTRPAGSAFTRGLAWDATQGSPMVADDAGAWNNVPAYVTGSATGNTGTINSRAGKLTTASLTTAAGSAQALTVTSSAVAAGDLVVCSIANGTNSAGSPVLGDILPASGSFTVQLRNVHASVAFNGTLVLSFLILKA